MRLLELGPSYGYFAEPAKSIIVVKEQHLQEAKALFSDLQVEVVLASHFLDGYVGDEAGVRQYVSDKVDTWVRGVEQLARAAKSYSQSAMLRSHILSPASGRTSSGSWKDARMSIANYVTPLNRSLPQPCSGERS